MGFMEEANKTFEIKKLWNQLSDNCRSTISKAQTKTLFVMQGEASYSRIKVPDLNKRRSKAPRSGRKLGTEEAP